MSIVRKNIRKIKLKSNCYLLVFHKSLDKGCGSAVSLYIHDIEFLKFDCFGHEKGHYHVFSPNKIYYFKEKTCSKQIKKTTFELTHNLQHYLSKSNNKLIKLFKINPMNTRIHLKFMKMMRVMEKYEIKYYKDMRF